MVSNCWLRPRGITFPTMFGSPRAFCYDIDTGQLLRRFNTNIDSHIYSVAFSPDGSRVLTGGEQATLWDVETGQQLRTFSRRNLSARVVSLAFSPDGKSVLLGMASSTGTGAKETRNTENVRNRMVVTAPRCLMWKQASRHANSGWLLQLSVTFRSPRTAPWFGAALRGRNSRSKQARQ